VAITLVAASADTTSALIAAGAVLAGVLAGGVITAATTAYFEHKREKADTRQARRLIAEELQSVLNHLDHMLKAGKYPRPDDLAGFLPTSQWESGRVVLARHIEDDRWGSLSPYVDSIHITREMVDEAPRDVPIPEDIRKILVTDRELAAECYAALTGPTPWEPNSA